MENNTIEKNVKLTSIEWRLYEVIKQHTIEHPGEYITHAEICDAMPNCFNLNHKAVNKECCSKIQRHILRINETPEVEKIIIYKNQSYKIAETEEEVEKFIFNKFQEKMNNTSHRMSIIREKVKRDGQLKLTSTRCVPIIDSQGRDYVETYLKPIEK